MDEQTKDITLAVESTTSMVERWVAGRGDDAALRTALAARGRIEIELLFDLDRIASSKLGPRRDETPLVMLDALMALPSQRVQDSLTDPICTAWLRDARQVCRDGSVAELILALWGLAPVAASALLRAGATSPPLLVELPAHFSLSFPAVQVVHPLAGFLEIEVVPGALRFDRGSLVVHADGRIEASDPDVLDAQPLPVAHGYGVRVEDFEPTLRRRFPRVVDGTFNPRLWVERLDASARLLGQCDPKTLAEMRRNLRVVVPTSPGLTEHHSTGNSREAWGAVNTSLVDEPFFSDGLIHEHRHDLLNTVSMVTPVFLDDGSALVEHYYSPWRPEPRPVIGVFHAVFVFVGVCELYMRILDDPPEVVRHRVAQVLTELGIQSTRLRLGVAELEHAGGLTDFGTQLLERLAARAIAIHGDAARQGAFEDPRVRRTLAEHYRAYQEDSSREAKADVAALMVEWTE